jgi:hypothetical protein
VLAALLWARVLHVMGQGFVAAGSTTSAAAEHKSMQTAENVEHAQAAEEDQGAAASKGCALTWTTAAQVCKIGLGVLAGELRPSVQLPGAAGCGKACAAAHQQLQQQCSQLQQQSAPLIDEVDKGKDSWGQSFYLRRTLGVAAASELPQDAAAAVSGFGAQLVQFGGALCAQLPVPLCCNNPGCVELRGASEQQLVAGKGSVCSRCRWVAAQAAGIMT